MDMDVNVDVCVGVWMWIWVKLWRRFIKCVVSVWRGYDYDYGLIKSIQRSCRAFLSFFFKGRKGFTRFWVTGRLGHSGAVSLHLICSLLYLKP